MAAKGRLSALYAEVLGARQKGASDQWLAALERGDADANSVRAGLLHGAGSPSATPYLDLALAGGTPEDWGIDLSGARPLRWPGFQRLLTAGVPPRFAGEMNAAGDILAAQVDLVGPSGFAIGGPDGRLLLVVRGADAAPVDVIAFRIDAPDEVAALYGAGAGLLGEFNLPADFAGRLVIVETPLDWLRGGGRGVCVYDWAAALPTLRGLGEAVTLEAPPALASVLRARLERGGLPLVASAVAEGAKLSLAERIGRAA